VDRLATDWGFNFVRYLILWDALEPQPGEYSQSYLNKVEDRMDWFAEAGIHVVIDMHQDVYSRVFCCDGAPAWAIRDDGLPFFPQPLWQLNYFQPAVTRAFDNFWDYGGPHSDLQDHYVEAWVHVALRLRDHPAVIGYDLMNEPFPGSYTSKIEVLGGVDPNNQSAFFEQTLLRPFYERVIHGIRQVDPDAWVFYEPRFAGPANGFPSYIEPLADVRDEPRLVSSPHFYSFLVDIAGSYTPDDPAFPRFIENRRTEMAIQRAPLVIGEWGAVDTTPDIVPFFEHFLRMADAESSGWAFWEYTTGGGFAMLDANGVEKPYMNSLVRAYPQRVAGHPLDYGYDPTSRVMTLTFRNVDGVTGPTEIYVPAVRHYPGGFEVASSDPDGAWAWSWDPNREIVSLRVDSSQEIHAICVSPAGSSCTP
jgi:endoglycosylceramidase